MSQYYSWYGLTSTQFKVFSWSHAQILQNLVGRTKKKKIESCYQTAPVLLITLIIAVGIYPKRDPIYRIFVQFLLLLPFSTSFIQFACDILSLHPGVNVIKEITLVLSLFKELCFRCRVMLCLLYQPWACDWAVAQWLTLDSGSSGLGRAQAGVNALCTCIGKTTLPVSLHPGV